MVGICSFILIVLFGIPISLIIDHTIDYRRALQKHRMFPDVYPNPKKKKPRKLTEEEKLAVEKSRKAAEDAAKRVAERNQKIRDLFYEDYVSKGDFVRINPMCHEAPGLYRVIKTGATREGNNVYECYQNTYDPYKKARIALCERIETESGEFIPESEREQTRCAYPFSMIMKCYITGVVRYNDAYEWGKEQAAKIHELTGFNNDHSQDRYRNETATIKKALGIPVAYAKYTQIRPGIGVHL